MKRKTRVEIEWVDSNIMHDWASEDEVSLDKLPSCFSVGYFFSEDDEKVIITMGYSNYGLYIIRKAIPKGCIKSIKELRIK